MDTDKTYDISEVEEFYANWYSPDSPMSKDDQRWIWELFPLPELEESRRKCQTIYSVNGNDNGTCRFSVNNELLSSKLGVNLLPEEINSKTPPKKVAEYLEKIFEQWPSKTGHWLYIAQLYTPRVINRVIVLMNKQQERGEKTICNFAALFTLMIRYRKKRVGITFKKFER